MTTTVKPMPRMTLAEFRALPEGPPQFELEEGELIPMTFPTATHQTILLEMGSVLSRFVRKEKLGRIVLEVDVFLPDGTVYIPDLTFVAEANSGLFDPQDDKIHGVPDLVIEITSTAASRDRVRKFRRYEKNGVRWYWLVDQDLVIEEYQWTSQGYLRAATVDSGETFAPKIFPGLIFDLAEMLGVSVPPEPENA